jgi:hypothetical protein
MPGLLETIRRAVELQRQIDDMFRERTRKEMIAKARKLAPSKIEEALGKYVNLPPKEKWEIEPLDEHILAEDKGWLNLCLRVKIDDLELFVGASINGDAIIMIRGWCRACQEYLYYSINLNRLENGGLKYFMEMIDIASQGMHWGSRCFPQRKE